MSRHTGENIERWIIETLEEFEIGEDQIFCFCTDSGSNVSKSIKLFIEKTSIDDEDETNDEISVSSDAEEEPDITEALFNAPIDENLESS